MSPPLPMSPPPTPTLQTPATPPPAPGPTDAGYSAIAARSGPTSHRLPLALTARAAVSPGRGSPRAGPVPASAWSWPLSPRPAVLRAFDPPAKPWLSGHRGVDLEAALRRPAHLAGRRHGELCRDRGGPAGHHDRSRQRATQQFRAGGEFPDGGVRRGRGRRPGACTGRPLRPGPALSPLGRPPRRRLRQPAGFRDGPSAVGPAPAPIRVRDEIWRRFDARIVLDAAPAAAATVRRGRQTIAEMPVIARPVTRVLISCVPS